MRAARKKVLMVAGGVALMAITAIVTGVLLFDINSHKHRIEAAASEATGLGFRINGKMGLSLFPFGVSAHDIHVANKEGEILSLGKLTLEVRLMSLLQKQLKVTGCELIDPTLTIVKDVDGKYNFENYEKKPSGEGINAPSSFRELKLSQGALVYLDKKTGEKTEFKGINLSLKDLSIGGSSEDILKSLSFTGAVDFKEVSQKKLRIEDLKTTLKVVKGVYTLDPLSIGALVYFDKTDEKTEWKEVNLEIKDLSMGDPSEDILSSVSFTGTLDCREVSQKNFRIEDLKAPVRAVQGIYSFEPLAMGSIVYFDKKAGDKTELKEIGLAIKDLSIVDTSEDIIRNISFTGSLDCKTVRKKDLKVDNVKSSIKVEKGVIHLAPLTMDIFDAQGEGDATADKSRDDAVYKINLRVSKLDFATLEGSFGAKKVIGGKGDLHAALTINEKGSRDLVRSTDGTVSLRGDNLVIYTMDLDKVLSSYETTQELDLVDLGAFFIAGPLGTAGLKGYRYGGVYNQLRGGQGVIKQLASHWKIKHGVASAADCALATQHNRVALKGKLNLVTERYDNVTVALLDHKGCAKFKQSISGPFDSPEISTVSAVASLGGPISNFFGKAKRFVQGGRCEVFYRGSVRQP